MKVGIITDQHFGVRNDNLVFLSHQEKFYEKVFFPTLSKHGIDTVLDLGDTFDRRKYVNYHTLAKSKNMYFNELYNRDITLHTITGNHTTYFKNTNEINSLDLLLKEYSNIKIYWDLPHELELGSTRVLLVPWINPTNYEQAVEIVSQSKAQVLMGHLEIQGFEMMKGRVCDHGMDKEAFKRFEAVYSGHFHHPSTHGNITYLGAPYEMNWTDYAGRRGFHIFDTETREMEFIENPYAIFHKIHYDDDGMTIEDVASLETDGLDSTYIKVVVGKKNNPYIFDLFIDKIQASGAADVKVVEDHMNLDVIDESELIDEAQDTITIMNKYVEALELGDKKIPVQRFLENLYQEALSV